MCILRNALLYPSPVSLSPDLKAKAADEVFSIRVITDYRVALNSPAPSRPAKFLEHLIMLVVTYVVSAIPRLVYKVLRPPSHHKDVPLVITPPSVLSIGLVLLRSLIHI